MLGLFLLNHGLASLVTHINLLVHSLLEASISLLNLTLTNVLAIVRVGVVLTVVQHLTFISTDVLTEIGYVGDLRTNDTLEGKIKQV